MVMMVKEITASYIWLLLVLLLLLWWGVLLLALVLRGLCVRM